MGGTTAKAGVISEGKPLTTGSALIGGYEQALPIQIPMIDIFEVGTGGGSIARVGEGNALRVGPQSAGSMPGPACYGRGGTEPTVTDANLLLGRLDADHFLGGEMELDLEAAASGDGERSRRRRSASTPTERRTASCASRSPRCPTRSRRVTTERGLDAGGFTMVVYGGAGPLHASAIAREIGIRRVLIPYAPGYFSAYGMLFSDLRYDYVRSCFRRLDDVAFDEIEALYAAMEERGPRGDRASGVAAGWRRHRARRRHALRRPGARRHGRPAGDVVREQGPRRRSSGRSTRCTRIRYGTSAPEGAGRPGQPAHDRARHHAQAARAHVVEQGGAERRRSGAARRKPVYFRGPRLRVDTPVYERDPLRRGNRIAGPGADRGARLHHRRPARRRLEVDAFGNLHIAIGSDRIMTHPMQTPQRPSIPSPSRSSATAFSP